MDKTSHPEKSGAKKAAKLSLEKENSQEDSAAHLNLKVISNGPTSSINSTLGSRSPVKLNFVRKISPEVAVLISRTELEELLIKKINESVMSNWDNIELRSRLDKLEEKTQSFKKSFESVQKQLQDLQAMHSYAVRQLKENPSSRVEPLKIVRSIKTQTKSHASRCKQYSTSRTQITPPTPQKRKFADVSTTGSETSIYGSEKRVKIQSDNTEFAETSAVITEIIQLIDHVLSNANIST